MSRSLRILLVEDHPDTQFLMQRLLETFRHEVETAGSVQDALRIAGMASFDLVISDLGLPDGSGLTLMQALRDRHGLKGIALSGYGLDEDHARSLAAGFQAHLVKPINFEKLQQVIGTVVAQEPS